MQRARLFSIDKRVAFPLSYSLIDLADYNHSREGHNKWARR